MRRESGADALTIEHLIFHDNDKQLAEGLDVPALFDALDRLERDHGATVYLIDRAGEARIAREGEARGAELERLRGVYVVVATDGTIRTVGHRTWRRRRH